MREFELTLVLKPNLERSKIESLLKKIRQWFKELGGGVKKETEWGKKKLAYPIKKETEGLFLFLEIELEEGTKELEKKFNLEDKILRYLFVKKRR